jgi:hydrogenase maturation protease
VKTTLVAGVGNILFSDDGFGCAVAQRLSGRALPEGVRVRDFGIAGMHLALELTSGYEAAILVDAVARGGAPASLCLLEPDAAGEAPPCAGGHGLDLASVLALLPSLGTPPGRLLVVGCEALSLDEGIGLSAPVERAVEGAIALVESLLVDGAPARAVEEGVR